MLKLRNMPLQEVLMQLLLLSLTSRFKGDIEVIAQLCHIGQLGDLNWS